jgi:hypothetical protein
MIDLETEVATILHKMGQLTTATATATATTTAI